MESPPTKSAFRPNPTIWERIKEHAERTLPYGPLWFEAQFHIALLNYWSEKPDQVRFRYLVTYLSEADQAQ